MGNSTPSRAYYLERVVLSRDLARGKEKKNRSAGAEEGHDVERLASIQHLSHRKHPRRFGVSLPEVNLNQPSSIAPQSIDAVSLDELRNSVVEERSNASGGGVDVGEDDGFRGVGCVDPTWRRKMSEVESARCQERGRRDEETVERTNVSVLYRAIVDHTRRMVVFRSVQSSILTVGGVESSPVVWNLPGHMVFYHVDLMDASSRSVKGERERGEGDAGGTNHESHSSSMKSV